MLLGGLVCLIEPDIIHALFDVPEAAGAGRRRSSCSALVALYVAGSALHLRPLALSGIPARLPAPGHHAAPDSWPGRSNCSGAAGHHLLRAAGGHEPGFIVVLGVFLASFSAALLSHAPGGLGVLELVFVTAMPEVPQADVLAALLVFRLLYFILPLMFGIVAVVLFERSRFARVADRRRSAG